MAISASRIARATAFSYHRDSVILFTALLGLYWFAASFFLAKHSLPLTSQCDEASNLLRYIGLTDSAIHWLQTQHVIADATSTNRQGCWMDRKVDALVVLVVDALRFDFCLYHLPRSVGSRLPSTDTTNPNHTRLFRFVADPPTVTMQRLKALTTGGLPTFADISANFGGATIEDDNWLWQLSRSPFPKRGGGSLNMTHLAFVGDDTWLDLYPDSFTHAFPYPSFNTRDLDSVDNGCLHHLPELIDNLRPKNELELIVVHFLGVDHVGHTYGPNNEYMDAKLQQMDAALSYVLDSIDSDPTSCRAALIFGDHGMTPDGNHGGGTIEEVSAALFVHSSSACGEMAPGIALEYETSFAFGDLQLERNTPVFASIHQIDLVPTLSIMLGLPIPFANLGSLVPSLVPLWQHKSTSRWYHTTTALALNAAQVWRYLTTYSATANALPSLDDLHFNLRTAVSLYQKVLDDAVVMKLSVFDLGHHDDNLEQASVLFKHFLAQSLELGQRVWTRFNIRGMVGGIIVIALSLLLYVVSFFLARDGEVLTVTSQRQYYLECAVAILFLLYQCGLLTFSNSYILEEERGLMYCLSILSLALSVRLRRANLRHLKLLAVLIPIASRVGELFVSGHGMDPSIRLHLVHSAASFCSSLILLAAFRLYLVRRRLFPSSAHTILDSASLACLGFSWWEKRDLDPSRHGFGACRLAIGFVSFGILVCLVQHVTSSTMTRKASRTSELQGLTLFCKLLISIMIVSGPSSASTLCLFVLQLSTLYALNRYVPCIPMCTFIKLVTRHVFFASNHGCAFNRLQYSAAFVATIDFYFVTGGISLFLNTFGWEIAGLAFCWMLRRPRLWRFYIALQLVEALTSCISVSLLRRHLMVWDVYAPHFLFTCIFTVLAGLSHITLSILDNPSIT